MLTFSLSKRSGMSTVEFLFAAIPILLLGLGAYEITRWYNTKHALNLALVEASRQGSVHNANPKVIEKAFEHALLPLFANHSQGAQKGLAIYLKNTSAILKNSPWKIYISNPKDEHFYDFHRNDLAIVQQTGLPAIDNNYQKEQHEQKKVGEYSRDTIFQANTLTLSLTYPYKPIVPGIASLMKLLSSIELDYYDHDVMANGFIPMGQTVSISMQSHPVAWPTSFDDKVYWHVTPDTTTYPPRDSDTPKNNHINQHHCVGIWCDKKVLGNNNNASSSGAENTPNSNTDHTDNTGTNGTNIPPYQEHPKERPPSHQETSPSTPHHDDSLCGVSLCC